MMWPHTVGDMMFYILFNLHPLSSHHDGKIYLNLVFIKIKMFLSS
jgi:hypothetical protein